LQLVTETATLDWILSLSLMLETRDFQILPLPDLGGSGAVQVPLISAGLFFVDNQPDCFGWFVHFQSRANLND
jgi:hypothetical protein